MPTGYTDIIKDGISFRDFALRCSRAFGALIEMRDEPMDAPLQKEFKPSDYHLTAGLRASERLTLLDTFSVQDAQRQCKKEYEDALTSHKNYTAKKEKLKIQYEAMLEKVKAWQPPTSEHFGLKEFMIKQITESIDWDCKDYSGEPIMNTPKKWLQEEKENCIKKIKYHEKKYAEEVQRCKERTEWVNQLINSL